MRKNKRVIFTLVLVASLVLQCFTLLPEQVKATVTTPYERYGAVKICDYDHDSDPNTQARRQLCDTSGNPIQLRGMSTCNILDDEAASILNASAFDALALDWKCDVIRLTMTMTESSFASSLATIMNRIESGIGLADAKGMYVIVDWNIKASDDLTNLDSLYLNPGAGLDEFAAIKQTHSNYNGAQLFFAYLSKKYGDKANILWEVNYFLTETITENNASTIWSSTLHPYYQNVVNAVRENDKDAVNNIIICGTDDRCQFVGAPAGNPISDTDNQIMYALNVYSGTDTATSNNPDVYPLRTMTDAALENGLAVFCTEWRTSKYHEDDGPYINNAVNWLEYMENAKISWCSWSISNSSRISAALKYDTATTPGDNNQDGIHEWSKDECTYSGNFVRAMIRQEETPQYTDSVIAEDFEHGIGKVGINDDSPNKNISFSEGNIDGQSVLKVSGINTGSTWDNRIVLKDLGTEYGSYDNLEFDIYFDKNIDTSDINYTTVNIRPVILSIATGWWGDNIPEQDYLVSDLTDMGSHYKTSCSFSISPLNPNAGDTLGHILFLISLSQATEGKDIYFANIRFTGEHNGDVIDTQNYIMNHGSFIEFPFDFDSNLLEGWKWYGTQCLGADTMHVGNAETSALAFPVYFDSLPNRNGEGIKVSSPNFSESVLPYSDCTGIKAISMDVYTKGIASRGTMTVSAGLMSEGGEWLYNAGSSEITPATGAGSRYNLIHYYVNIPISDDGSYPFDSNARIENLVLGLKSNNCDFLGEVFYDNINLLDASGVAAVSHDVVFNTNGGTCDIARKTYVSGRTYGSLPTPVRSGYSFLGWFTMAEGGVEVTGSTMNQSSAEQTFYARWQNSTPTPGTPGTSGTSSNNPTGSYTPSDPTTDGTVINPTGTEPEKKTETRSDGTKVTTEKKSDGTVLTTEERPDGSKVVNEKKPDGSEIETTTYKTADGDPVTKIMNKEPDGSSITKTSFSTGSKKTKVEVTTIQDEKGQITSSEADIIIRGKKKSGKAGISIGSIIHEITKAAGTGDVRIEVDVTNASGKPYYKLSINSGDIVPKAKLTVYYYDTKMNKYVMTKLARVKVNEDGSMNINLPIPTDREGYILVSDKTAAKVNKQILKTVKLSKSKFTLMEGKTKKVSISKKLNMDNVSKIKYSSLDKSIATVSKDGKIKTKKTGETVIKTTIQLANGTKKTLETKIIVK